MAVARDPGLGQAALPADNAAALLRRNAVDPDIASRPAIRFGDRTWTHAEYVAESCRWANLFLERRQTGPGGDHGSGDEAPFHVAVLLDNVPEYLFALGGAALSGATLVGLNHSRSGAALADDLARTHCGLLVSEPRHDDLLAPALAHVRIDRANLLRVGDTLEPALDSVPSTDPGIEPPIETKWALIFTSGTSSAPKAVICSQRRLMVTGNRMGMLMGIGPDDVGYVCMPLFHSNSLMVGWAPTLVFGASVALARKFSASGWLPDVRRYGATYWNYTGKPLAYLMAQPDRPDDADNPLRIAYGNEGAPELVDAFARRFGVEVIDAFGATEGGLAVSRTDDDPPGAMGKAGPGIVVVDEAGNALPPAEFGPNGELLDAQACVGEIVNTNGVGVFEGYYNNDEANAKATRNGWYWSGDLGYLDADGYLYFAGRDAEWIRVDGENFPAGPIDVVLGRHPDVRFAAAYGVPDPDAGDQVMAALVLDEGAGSGAGGSGSGGGVRFDPAGFAAWLDAQDDLAPKWRPRYVRVTAQLPTSPTNKILKRALVHDKYRPDRVGTDTLWVRDRGAAEFRPFTEDDASALRRALESSGRARFWDL